MSVLRLHSMSRLLLLSVLLVQFCSSTEAWSSKRRSPPVSPMNLENIREGIRRGFANKTQQFQSAPKSKARRQDDCSFFFTDLEGEFSSPNYPGDYPNNAVCTWEIEAPSDHRIRLSFDDFRLETSSGCTKDFVEVYDGAGFHLFCGRDTPAPVDSVGNVMSILFITDAQIHAGDKFLAKYVAFQGTGTPPTEEPWTGTGTPPPRTTTESNGKTTTGGGGEPGDCSASVDVSDPTVWGFYATPNHPGNYPGGTKCAWEFLSAAEEPTGNRNHHHGGRHPGAASFYVYHDPNLARENSIRKMSPKVEEPLETRIGFLRFKTSAGDAVTLLDEDVTVDSAEGDLQTDNGNHTMAAATFRRASPQLTVSFSGSKAEAGFLFFVAKALPAVLPPKASGLHDRLTSKIPPPPTVKPKFSELRRLAIASGKVINIDMRQGVISAPSEALRRLAKFGGPIGSRRQDDADYGHFMSPNHPEFYNNDETLLYNITAPASQQISIFFARFETEKFKDWVAISDVGGGDNTIFMSANGRDDDVFDNVYLSQTNQVQVVFHTDPGTESTGFLAAFAAVTTSS